MKKFVYLFFIAYLCAACMSVGVFAQQQKANPQNPSLSSNKQASSTADGRSFGKGSKFLNLGAGLAAYSYANAGFFPALSASLDVGFKENLGPGTLGLGGTLGYWQSRYNYGNNYRSTWRNIMLAARGTYYLDALNAEKYNVYFGALAGLRMYNYTDNFLGDISDSSIHPAFGFFAGGRYMLGNKFGLFGEAGYGMTWLTLGVSLKL